MDCAGQDLSFDTHIAILWVIWVGAHNSPKWSKWPIMEYGAPTHIVKNMAIWVSNERS